MFNAFLMYILSMWAGVERVDRIYAEKLKPAARYLKALALRADAAGVAVFTSMYSANLLIMRAG